MEPIHSSARFETAETDTQIRRSSPDDLIIALAGNPNVGKSTVFNGLTGLHQHTGNWPGKTVVCTQGSCTAENRHLILVDLPGTYSLMANSAEELIARDFLCFGGADAAIVVCDATCLERSLNLVLQALELQPGTVVCVNLMDEAERKGISVDLPLLSQLLGVPVIGTSASHGRGLAELAAAAVHVAAAPPKPIPVSYPSHIEQSVSALEKVLEPILRGRLPARWAALRLLSGDLSLLESLSETTGLSLHTDPSVVAAVAIEREHLMAAGTDLPALTSQIVSSLVKQAESICSRTVGNHSGDSSRDRRLDQLFTSRRTGIPVMLLLLLGVFWITIEGANIPSSILAGSLFRLQDFLSEWFTAVNAPEWLHGLLIDGVYRTLAWVISVMLPPMAIFFPIFTLLEDFGYLPRVAFVMDHAFHRAGACGKQALTLCMGFGCNAAGVIGCRIIDSPRERLIAIMTNNLVPCNGRFPTLIAILTMFFAGSFTGLIRSSLSAVILTGVIVLSVGMTLLVSRLLSGTLLKGIPSSFTLELPPFRKPRLGQVLIRSVLDRTLFVLGRAAAVAAPAGLILWLCANIQTDGLSILQHCIRFLDPFAHLLGLDGVILMAFILGFPANEIVIPIMMMGYLATGTLEDFSSLDSLRTLLLDNGWTWLTAVCTMIFSLMHWPCSTTCLTIGKETRSFKWTALSFLIPAGIGMIVCASVAAFARLFGLV